MMLTAVSPGQISGFLLIAILIIQMVLWFKICSLSIQQDIFSAPLVSCVSLVAY